MQEDETLTTLRNEARAFEESLPVQTRKTLGQFFTGIRLGRMLAHLALEEGTRRVLDPMAGSGDLLDAVCEVAISRGGVVDSLDAIEVDPALAMMCKRRLSHISTKAGASIQVLSADAFDHAIHRQFPGDGYDLVITNPPYVRYQAISDRADEVRHRLQQIVSQRLRGSDRDIWQTLAASYSGLADLSIPAWLLCGLLVRPGGRLAIVAPATWRSREYSDVIRYLLLRCFSLELVIEDTQPGWFSNALVRTHLILARRLSDEKIADTLASRKSWSNARWIQVAANVASSDSLVGNAFDVDCPESAFADWCWMGNTSSLIGVSSRTFSHENEWASLCRKSQGREWLAQLEPEVRRSPLVEIAPDPAFSVPEAVRDLMPNGINTGAIRPMEDIGVRVGQGLRTGCNRFFYVHEIEESRDGLVTVTTNAVFGPKVLRVPKGALKPVLHRQADLKAWQTTELLKTHALVLRDWVLPEEFDTVLSALPSYREAGENPPQTMTDDLAEHVRTAGIKPLEVNSNSKPVSAFSAVRTNARPARGNSPPSFLVYASRLYTAPFADGLWFPVFCTVHRRFMATVIPHILIDANFSTFWTQQPEWSIDVLTAFLNSVWCRVIMEAVGTPLGGGALKLEAVHLRRMPVPVPEAEVLQRLERNIRLEKCDRQKLVDRALLGTLLHAGTSVSKIDAFAKALYIRLDNLVKARRRTKQ